MYDYNDDSFGLDASDLALIDALIILETARQHCLTDHAVSVATYQTVTHASYIVSERMPCMVSYAVRQTVLSLSREAK